MTKFLEGLKKDERGLTLIELLAVVVILAIVAAIAFVLIGNVIENSKKDAAVSDALQMISAAKLYEATGNSLETEGKVGLDKLQEAELIEPIYDAWDQEVIDASKASVTKDDEGYTVVLNHSGCKLAATEQVLLKDGRGACAK